MAADLAIVVLAVTDVARAKAFYVAVFGWNVGVDLPNYVQLRLPGAVALSLYERKGYAQQTGTLPALCPDGACTATELYIAVDDLEVLGARLLKAGGRLLSAAAPRDWGDTVAYYRDLDGNVIAIYVAGDTQR